MTLIIVEVWSYIQLPIIWWLFKRFAKRNVLGEMIAGTMIGAFNEFATEPLWDYHLRLNIYKDTPLILVLGWGVMFTLVTFVSEKLYCRLLKKDRIEPYDKRIFLFDVLAGALVCFPIETACAKLGLWTYRWDRLAWDWGNIPVINMPLEALFGYSLLMLVGPTFVRYWERPLEGGR